MTVNGFLTRGIYLNGCAIKGRDERRSNSVRLERVDTD